MEASLYHNRAGLPPPYITPTAPDLSGDHMRMLLEESGITSEITAERGYRTVRRAEVPDVFKPYQRKNGLLIPTLSPSGKQGARLRPDKPRVDKKGKLCKYEQPGEVPCRPDIHPRNFHRLKDPSVPLWFVEGEKKADALTSRGECVIALTGVWMFSQDKKFHPELENIPYQGRTVYIGYDSDIASNGDIQRAAERLSGELERRGAHVLVVYLPDAPDGSKQGADDFLAAKGTVEEMLAHARPFERIDVGRVRLGKDEELRRAVEELGRTYRTMSLKTRGENTRRSIMRILIEEATRSGKLAKDGVRVRMAQRPLAERAACSLDAVSRAITYMEAEGYLRRDNVDRKRDTAGEFVLLTGRALPEQVGSNVVKGGNLQEGSRERFDSYGECDPGVRVMRGVPELRWSTTYKRQEVDKFGRAVEVREYLARLGKKSGEIVRYLLHAGGSAAIEELMELFAGKKTRPRDFKRRTLAPLTDPAVIIIEGDIVTLTDHYLEAIEQHRTLGGEIEQARLQRERHARQREAFRNRDKLPEPEPVPEAPPVDDLRQPWPYHPEPCACRECVARFGKVLGEHVEDCRCGQCALARREKSKARTRPLLRVVEAPPEPEPMHPLSCECDSCLYPTPRYARPARGGP